MNALTEKVKQELPPSACYPVHHQQIYPALLWVSALIIFSNDFTLKWNFAGEHFS